MASRLAARSAPFDYIIIGAGSAGCALASRLSEDPDVRVLLLEAGGRDWHPFIHMPAGLAKLVHRTDLNWNYHTAPEPQLDGRRLWWPRGRVLGGSSAINAMCYTRGVPRDYDDWAKAGAEGWHWAAVLPYFRRSDDNARGADALHGGDGPLSVCDLAMSIRSRRPSSTPRGRQAWRTTPTSMAPRSRASASTRSPSATAPAARPRRPTWHRRGGGRTWSSSPTHRRSGSRSDRAAPTA